MSRKIFEEIFKKGFTFRGNCSMMSIEVKKTTQDKEENSMYKKFVEAMVERTIERYFNVTVFSREVKHSTTTELVDFKVRASGNDKSTSYEGFVGTVGQIVVTTIDNKRLPKEEYIIIN